MIGPIKRPMNPPITEAGKKSFLKVGMHPRNSVPTSSKALNTQKQYNSWVNMAFDMRISLVETLNKQPKQTYSTSVARQVTGVTEVSYKELPAFNTVHLSWCKAFS
jgi:hypothetical protein